MGKSKEKGEGARRAGGSSSFPSPSSSSSSDFEFTVSLSPSSRRSSSHLCPADELFYKGQLLPLHLSPRISMVHTLLLASSSASSSSTDTATTASRDSNGSSSSSTSSADILLLPPECDSSRPSSATEEDARRAISSTPTKRHATNYFSSFANRFSSVFLHRGGSKKDPSASVDIAFHSTPPAPARRANTSSASARQVIKKYVKKVKPLYERLKQTNNQQHYHHQQQQQQQQQKKKKTFSFSIRREADAAVSNRGIVECIKKLNGEGEGEERDVRIGSGAYSHSHSFSGNLRYPRRKRCAGSCPSSMRSSPTHSGLLRINGGAAGGFPTDPPPFFSSSSSSSTSSSMEELQSAIQGAIAHCKSTMMIQSNHK